MLYEGKTICYSTQHGKETQSRKLFQAALGAQIYVPPHINTDVLGTFSGEIPRPGKPQEVVRQKCILGLELSGLRIGVANEGSFGPHPYVPFIPNATELIYFIDNDRGIEIYEHSSFCKTNFHQSEVSSLEDLHKVMQLMGYPQHSLIIRPAPNNTNHIYKGLRDIKSIEAAYQKCRNLSSNGMVSVESDMRAHHNLTRRMSLIKLTKKLVRRILSACPKCKSPGWGETGVEPGLPCKLCHTRTLEIKCRVFACTACQHEEKIPESKTTADPKFCPCCNP